jgi:phosphatidylglycerophosphate synthase
MGGVAWLLVEWPWVLFGLMALAALTDMLDGFIARRLKLQGRGAWLDPVCDKIFVASVAAAVWFFLQPAWHLLILIALREILQLPLMAALFIAGHGRSYNFKSAYLGKATTVAQFLALAVMVFRGDVGPWAWLAAALGVLSVIQYAGRAANIQREQGDT